MPHRRYSVPYTDTLAAGVSAAGVEGAVTVRPGVYDIIIGSAATPADNAAEIALRRFSGGLGTNVAVAPSPLDPEDPAADADGAENYSVEPTTPGVQLLLFPFNQRATFRWVAGPGSEMWLPANATSGVTLIAIAVASGFVGKGTILFVE